MGKIDEKIQKLLATNKFISIEEYAKKKKLSPWYVRKLCRDSYKNNSKKKVEAYKLGKTWVVKEN